MLLVGLLLYSLIIATSAGTKLYVKQGMVQGYSLSPILFSVFINDLLIAVEQNIQAGSLESINLDGAKPILGFSSNTCNEAVRGDMGLDTL